MPELLSIHGRCPRCSQVLTVPAGQLQSVFRCARCQYRVPGAVFVDEARSSPPRLGSARSGPVLGPFDEDTDDQHTRMHLPGSGVEEEPEVPLAAVLVDNATASAPPPPPSPLSRFDAESDDNQQTRLHVAGSFDAPAPPRPVPANGTLVGMPAAQPLTRFDASGDDADDQATRVHVVDGPAETRSAPDNVRDRTLIGVPRTQMFPAQGAAQLSRFDQVVEDGEDQNTRLQVPISYEVDDPGGAAELRPIVAPRPSFATSDYGSLSPSQRFGRATLQLSRWIEDWLLERHAPLLVTLAMLTAIIAPVLDALLGNSRHGATVIAANLALFFSWTLSFAWLGKLRNDGGAWDYRIAFTRISTGIRLAQEDLGSFGALPQPLRWRVVADLSGAVGLVGLAFVSALTLTHLVWGWPAATGGLLLWRVFTGMLIVLSLVASREAANVPAGLSPAPDVTAPAVALFPAVLDLSLPLSVPPAHAATPLHHVLEVLSQWRPREWPNQDSYLAVLERHLLRRMGWTRIEREHRLTSQRSDGIAHVIVDKALLIEVVHGFDAATAERVTARMRLHAKSWRGKPAIIVVFDASRAELLNGAGTASLEALHRSYPMLTVRMPSARMSLAS